MHSVCHSYGSLFPFIYERNAGQKTPSEKYFPYHPHLYHSISVQSVSLVLRLDAYDTDHRDTDAALRFPGNGAELHFPTECPVLLHQESEHDDDEKRRFLYKPSCIPVRRQRQFRF